MSNTAFNPQAAYGTFPKALTRKHLKAMKGSTVKVFLAIMEATDCYYRIKIQRIKKSKVLADAAGVHQNSVRSALKELSALGIIDGYVPGQGESRNEFYLSFDINHYTTCSCLELEELEDYFKHLSLRRLDGHFLPGETKIVTGCDKNSYTCDNNSHTILKELNINNAKIKLFLSDPKFNHEFNEFCIENNATYRTKTFHWIAHNAERFGLSVSETTEALKAANDKDLSGVIKYVVGVMRKIRKRKDLGIRPVGMNQDCHLYDYVEQRMKSGLEFLSFYAYDPASKVIRYTMKSKDDEPFILDWLQQVIIDTERETGIKIAFEDA